MFSFLTKKARSKKSPTSTKLNPAEIESSSVYSDATSPTVTSQTSAARKSTLTEVSSPSVSSKTLNASARSPSLSHSPPTKPNQSMRKISELSLVTSQSPRKWYHCFCCFKFEGPIEIKEASHHRNKSNEPFRSRSPSLNARTTRPKKVSEVVKSMQLEHTPFGVNEFYNLNKARNNYELHIAEIIVHDPNLIDNAWNNLQKLRKSDLSPDQLKENFALFYNPSNPNSQSNTSSMLLTFATHLETFALCDLKYIRLQNQLTDDEKTMLADGRTILGDDNTEENEYNFYEKMTQDFTEETVKYAKLNKDLIISILSEKYQDTFKQTIQEVITDYIENVLPGIFFNNRDTNANFDAMKVIQLSERMEDDGIGPRTFLPVSKLF